MAAGITEIVGLFLLGRGRRLVVGAAASCRPLSVLAAGVWFVLFAGVVTVYIANATARHEGSDVTLLCGVRPRASIENRQFR